MAGQSEMKAIGSAPSTDVDAAPFPSPFAQAAEDIAAFFDVSLDMLCIRDMEGRMRTLSRSWETTLGVPLEELERVPLVTLIHPDDIEPTRRTMEIANAGGQVAGFVNRYRRRDGTYRHLEWWARRKGDLIYGVARDVTDRLKLEAERDAALKAAEAASQAKSDFLANVSHEIRTPLNGVIGIVDALSRTELSPHQAELVSLVATSGATLEALVTDLLDVAKIEAGRMELELRPFAPDALFAPILETFRLKAEAKGLALHVESWGLGRPLIGDGPRIAQVLTNLLSNAVKFTGEGSVTARLAHRDGVLRIEVSDTGVGFDPEAAGFLFQRFSQADASITRRFGGTGLGLSICRSLVELMGGTIEARSAPFRGATFDIRIPLAIANVVQSDDSEAGDEAAPLSGRRVLLAEDHPVNQRVVQLILESQGVELVVVEDGRAAVDAVASAAFDLVLMDMQMPIMDGLTATRMIRSREAVEARPRSPILMLSANAMAEHRQAAEEAGADRHLAKPITAGPLLAEMSAALAAQA